MAVLPWYNNLVWLLTALLPNMMVTMASLISIHCHPPFHPSPSSSRNQTMFLMKREPHEEDGEQYFLEVPSNPTSINGMDPAFASIDMHPGLLTT
jgi:hypothetical protein